MPLSCTAYLAMAVSNQPTLRALPVVAPNSFPAFAICAPVLSRSSVGKGPLPTLVVYALMTPRQDSTDFGGMPSPEGMAPEMQFDEVT